MLLNLATLRTEIAVRLRTPSLLSTSQKDLWLNQAQYDVASATDPENLVIRDTLTSVASTYKYNTKLPFHRITSVVDVTNQIELRPASMADIDKWDPARVQTGTATHYIESGLEYVRAQPAAAGTFSITSSSAADTTQKVYIRFVSSGIERWERLSLNGTSTVTGSLSCDVATDDIPTVFMVAKNTTTTGTVTVSRGAVTLSVIPPDYLAEERQPVMLWATPSASSVEYRVRGYRSPRPMLNVEDFPDFPAIYHELVLVGAVIRGHRSLFRFKEADALAKAEWFPKLEQFQKEQSNRRSSRPMVIGGSGRAFSYDSDQIPWDIVYGDGI